MKILLLGANGQVGRELQRQLSPFAELTCTTRSGLLPGGTACTRWQAEDPHALEALLDAVRPNVILNAVAYTAVDRAEQDATSAHQLNQALPALLAQMAHRHCALLVHYSTDYVFSGQAREPLREDDPTSPQSVYGRSKLAGELAVLGSACPHLVLRTQWVYGARGQNFLLTMLRLAREGKPLKVVDDQIGAPTPAAWIAAVTTALLLKWRSRSLGVRVRGLYHLSAAGHTTWHGFAEAIFAGAVARGLLARAPELTAISTRQFGAPAARPAWSVLDNRRLAYDFDLRLGEWHTGLEQVLDELIEYAQRSV